MIATADSPGPQAAPDVGADPSTIAQWVTQTGAERARYKAAQSRDPRSPGKTDEPGEDRCRSCATWPI